MILRDRGRRYVEWACGITSMSEPQTSDIVGADAFRRARDIFESALDWPARDRDRQLRHACGGDHELEALVERMLRADAEPHRLLDAGLSLSSEQLRPGDTVGTHLHVLALLGRGGMGEVYRAHDSALDRDVAIKILPWPTIDGAEASLDRLARFRREAQVLASLNHPNIAAIYGIEEWPSSSGPGPALVALVLELVEGPTLADRLAAGPIAIADALPLARQVAEALEAAHEQGIVHRDLKPANITLRPDGAVKLLDFGLAKVTQSAASSRNAVPPMITSPSLVQRGARLGTPAYMSPEQARGEEADSRSDIWAFGAVLYEMLAGCRAFPGDDADSSLGAVLHRPVDWSALDPSTPASVRTLLARCLDRDPRQRLRDIGEARIVLDDPSAAIVAGPRTAAEHPAWRRGRAIVAAALVGGAMTTAALWPGAASMPRRVSRFTLETSAASALDVDSQSEDLTITPAGAHIIYKGGNRPGQNQLFVRGLDQIDPTPLTTPGLPKAPFTSPDGQWVGYFEPVAGGPVLRRVAITGGPPVELCHVDGASRGATWGEAGAIILATTAPMTGLQRVPSGGGRPVVLTTPARERGEADHLWPQFLPGDRSVLFTITSARGGIDASQVAVLDLATGASKLLIHGGRQAHYVPSGHLVYVAGSALWAIAFDLTRLETRGRASLVVPQVLTLPTGVAEFDIARDGTLVYASGEVLSPKRTLVWVDRSGHEEPLGVPERPYAFVRLSPDATRVAVEIDDEENDIWVWSLGRRTLTRVTTDPGLDEGPIWAPDGRSLIFTSRANGAIGSLFRQSADGSGAAERLTYGGAVQRASAFLPDGAGLLFDQETDVVALTFDDARSTQPVMRTPQFEQSGAVSPDGRWLAYVAADAGQRQVFARPFPNVDAARTLVSAAGGSQPVWGKNGRELFYLAPSGALMGVTVGGGATFGAGPATRVLERAWFDGAGLTAPATYDVSPDGRRFLMIRRSDSGASAAPVRMVVVLNWFEELTRLVPPR